MKKFIICIILFGLILLIAVVGSILVTPNNEINKVEDILVLQERLDKDYTCYGYTVDNPKVVVNPYRVAPLSALIMFTTEEEEKVQVFLKRKDSSSYKLYEEDVASREHYLDIYGMQANMENMVTLVVKGKKYDYKIATKLDEFELSTEGVDIGNNEIYFVSYNNALVGINNEGEIGYYIDGFSPRVKQLDNGHLLVADSRVNNDGSYVGIFEIDMLGRVYNNYIIKDGYYNAIDVLENGNYLLVSDYLIEIDKQNGKVLKKIEIDTSDEWVSLDYNKENNLVVLTGKNKTLSYDYDGFELKDTKDSGGIVDNKIQLNIGNYYRQFKQNRFGENKETKVSDKNINLLFYKSVDEKYNECGIKFMQEFDRIVVNKKCDEDIYVVLDKFGGRKIYKVDKQEYYINTKNLEGKYSIYVSAFDKVYKTGYYVDV